nr:hypothetical protein [Stenotrophomonas maltophilia]
MLASSSIAAPSCPPTSGVAVAQTPESISEALSRGDLQAAIEVLRDPQRYRVLFKDPHGAERYIALAQQVADDAPQNPCIDRSSLLNAYTVLASGLDLSRSVHYLALSAALIEQDADASEQDTLEPALHPHALMHGYFEAGGGLALEGAVPGIDRAEVTAWRYGHTTLAYQPDLLLAFPLRMDARQRQRLFEVTGFTLLPASQWHDAAALRAIIRSDAYLDWLESAPLHLASRLSMALEEMATPPWPEHLRASGYRVHGGTPGDDGADSD